MGWRCCLNPRYLCAGLTAERALGVDFRAFKPARVGVDAPVVGVSSPPPPVGNMPLLCSLLRAPRGCPKSASLWAGARPVLVLALCRSLACLRSSRLMTTLLIVAARAVESSDADVDADADDDALSDRAECDSYSLSASGISRSLETWLSWVIRLGGVDRWPDGVLLQSGAVVSSAADASMVCLQNVERVDGRARAGGVDA